MGESRFQLARGTGVKQPDNRSQNLPCLCYSYSIMLVSAIAIAHRKITE
ncbi:MAG: hypothetical protein MUD14_20035 [Hydrococcus sp. Prado102]|nr:hypothetical protein [Hydrococcus sp. Prado102]